jgi:xanthine dehydrogenase YagS FAD-binding subunit
MNSFRFLVATPESTIEDGTLRSTSFIAGGTNLVDLMKLGVMSPTSVVDINPLPLQGITLDTSGLRIGALERMSDVAANALVKTNYPVISEALLKSASAQIRNMASIGGNLLQRTRCPYFRDVNSPCNKRVPGSGCPAIKGDNRMLAILGTSNACVASNPSDLAVALVALGASVEIQSQTAKRVVLLDEFYRLPGDTPHIENVLQPGELITAVLVPALPWAKRSGYLKIRDRESYEFALTSAAVALEVDSDGVIRQARLAAGGVGAKPWPLPAVEKALTGKPCAQSTFETAARLATEGARPLTMNGFKIDLLQQTLIRALREVGGVA